MSLISEGRDHRNVVKNSLCNVLAHGSNPSIYIFVVSANILQGYPRKPAFLSDKYSSSHVKTLQRDSSFTLFYHQTRLCFSSKLSTSLKVKPTWYMNSTDNFEYVISKNSAPFGAASKSENLGNVLVIFVNVTLVRDFAY